LFDQCLNALVPQLDDSFEIIVVDSASAPDQAAAVARSVAAHPGIDFIRLDRPGVALARNVMLRRARGKWFALIDDDALPASNWGEVARELAQRVSDQYAIIGGAVHPILPAGVQRKVGWRWQQLLSSVELKGEYDQTDTPRVVGANMWFRRTALLDVGGFPEQLGRVGRSLVSGEDKLPVHRLLNKGWRIWYCDRLEVGHHVHAERLTRKWAVKRAYWDGRSDRRIMRFLHNRPGITATLGVAAKLAVLSLLYFVPDAEREYFLRFWYDFGWLQETLWPPHLDV
jgi:glycosyltransferase involved in cell wall biosynthesis